MCEVFSTELFMTDVINFGHGKLMHISNVVCVAALVLRAAIFLYRN